jgi:hypothetical protein
MRRPGAGSPTNHQGQNAAVARDRYSGKERLTIEKGLCCELS